LKPIEPTTEQTAAEEMTEEKAIFLEHLKKPASSAQRNAT
jgi:hypothetical protein